MTSPLYRLPPLGSTLARPAALPSLRNVDRDSDGNPKLTPEESRATAKAIIDAAARAASATAADEVAAISDPVARAIAAADRRRRGHE